MNDKVKFRVTVNGGTESCELVNFFDCTEEDPWKIDTDIPYFIDEDVSMSDVEDSELAKHIWEDRVTFFYVSMLQQMIDNPADTESDAIEGFKEIIRLIKDIEFDELEIEVIRK